jgi:hypothetical protein
MRLMACFFITIQKYGGQSMLKQKSLGKKSVLLAAIILCTFLGANIQTAKAAESGCITCHLNKEMLKKNITAQKGAKSTMQSGAG